ncbi:protein kinase domain-containing protein [Actinocatenispora rupis]|uniref:non-specific serine/threonine protein kinase n=1 Tax=Actinocatenispora rupis TaxID=519421 RepID=A0A8J3JHU2_9ACTN|nr:NPCBM/NEW2 domain-containing protein [Actinocatenispora rupis]GID16138.1 hypothetical protein Aru02nite_70270 [Actinocatenispora rupis]
MTVGVRVGSRYVATDMIGRGAFGTVFRGEGPAGPVAIKLLRPDLATDAEVVDGFLRERSVLLRLRHPNLVSVRDLVAESDLLALVMDLIDGPDLRVHLQRQGPPPVEVATALVAAVADALAHTHDAGVIHRDLKPENVLLRLDGPAPVPLLTDFGIAELAAGGSAESAAHTVIGTPGYLAPEVARGGTATPAADVYACGVLAYELVTGRMPFAGEHALAVIHRQLTETPERPADLPDELWRTVSACLSLDPAERPTAGELAAALRGEWITPTRHTAVVPVSAAPTSAMPAHLRHDDPLIEVPRGPRRSWPLRIGALVLVAVLGAAGGYALRYGTARPAPTPTPHGSPTPAPTAISRYVTDLPTTQVGNGWGPVERNRSVGGQAPDDGGPLVLGTTTYQHGLGTNSPSQVRVYPAGACTSFTATIGIDAAAVRVQGGTVAFQVVGDGKALYDSGVVTWQTPPKPVQVDVTGVQVLDLVVSDGGDGNANDNADWADAALVCTAR